MRFTKIVSRLVQSINPATKGFPVRQITRIAVHLKTFWGKKYRSEIISSNSIITFVFYGLSI